MKIDRFGLVADGGDLWTLAEIPAIAKGVRPRRAAARDAFHKKVEVCTCIRHTQDYRMGILQPERVPRWIDH